MKHKSKTLKLALGEATHTHLMTSKSEIKYNIFEEEIEFILNAQGIITHEEHDRIVLPPGHYQKYPQAEYDPFTNNMRAVFD
jgi:hypothetical protein